MITRYNNYDQEIVTEQLLLLCIGLFNLCNYSLSYMNSNFSKLSPILTKILRLLYKKNK